MLSGKQCLDLLRARTYFQSLDTRTFSKAITPEVVICCALPSQKLPNTKVASE